MRAPGKQIAVPGAVGRRQDNSAAIVSGRQLLHIVGITLAAKNAHELRIDRGLARPG
jgi:hypothetical protein